MGQGIKGKAGSDLLPHDEAAKAMAGRVNRTYEAKIAIVVPAGQTNYSIKDNVANAFDKVPVGHNLSLKSNAAITIKLKTSDDATPEAIPVSPAVPWSSNFIEFEDILITNTPEATLDIVWS